MSLEILQSIQQAEEKAEEVRSDARKEAQEVIKSVETACAAAERSAAIEHRALYQQLLEQNRETVEKQLGEKSKVLAEQRAALCKDAETRLDAAAALIFERVVKHGNR